MSEIKKTEKWAAGATEQTADVKGKIIEYLWWLKKQGYNNSTVKKRVRLLRRLLKMTDVFDSEAVKQLLAERDDWSVGYKLTFIDAYDKFLEMLELNWVKPRYRQDETLPLFHWKAKLTL